MVRRFLDAAPAIFEVLAVCGIPTQLVLIFALTLAGLQPMVDGELSLPFFALLGLLDTALVALLIQAFLARRGEAPQAVLVGARSPGREALAGIAWTPLVFIGVLLVVVALRQWLPWLRTVDENPLDAFLSTPLDAAVFLVVAVLAGGVREELQRAYILHRFDRDLGGIRRGLVIFTLYFGVMHADQGADVAVAIGLLGLFWGLAYVRRRSAVFAMVNHAGFNALQVGQAMLARSLGVG